MFVSAVHINEAVGRSGLALVALGTHSLQDSLMFHKHASPQLKQKYLPGLVSGEIAHQPLMVSLWLRFRTGEIHPSFAMTGVAVCYFFDVLIQRIICLMTEPDVASSDPTALKTEAKFVRENGKDFFIINGHKVSSPALHPVALFRNRQLSICNRSLVPSEI